jgi:hypothetical protein|tara:strand:- start:2774 stop:3028 length:255 start_codon:yes stop_codon:yes gene_type:complete
MKLSLVIPGSVYSKNHGENWISNYITEKIMDRLERMDKSDKARAKRKLTKTIIKTIQKRYYADMKHLREKYKKIRQRHHDGKLQ